jgi:hypothetical protein
VAEGRRFKATLVVLFGIGAVVFAAGALWLLVQYDEPVLVLMYGAGAVTFVGAIVALRAQGSWTGR